LKIHRKARQQKQGMPWGWTIAQKVVFNKVRTALGLDRARFLATAAAPMPEDTAEFFLSLNIPICDVYALIFIIQADSE
jgi:long-chain-fatty-acid--CoA ligase ACSBG